MFYLSLRWDMVQTALRKHRTVLTVNVNKGTETFLCICNYYYLFIIFKY